MQADYIGEIIGKLSDLPYKCILFDGEWGIGKTYTIDESLKEQDNVCKISMFGLQNCQQIYHEALFQLALKNNKGGKIGEIAQNILEGAATIWNQVAQVKDVLQSIAKERELFLLLSKEFDSLHTIVIDDLERLSNSISMEEVLGVVEELKQCNYVKVILIANLEELLDEENIFAKYNEKVIDRVYKITERSENINWGVLGIHAGFINDFLSKHKVKNLRTLQKAQNFYDDVKLYCEDINSEQFLNEIRLICFAIVVESIDQLYYQEPDEEERDTFKKAMVTIHNELENRIARYLTSVKSNSLVAMLFKYYKNEEMLVFDNLKTEYELFLQAGCKPNYYKSDEEIKRVLPDLLKKIISTSSLGELNKFTDEYVTWSDILELDVIHALKIYKNKVHDMLLNQAADGHVEIWDYEYDLWHMEAKKVKEIYNKEREIVRRELITKYIDYLSESTKGEQAYEYSYSLRKCFPNSDYREIIKENVDKLYNRNSFPLDNIEDQQYRTCYNIMYVLYHIDNDRFLSYCEKLVKKCDKMSAHRVDILVKEITKGI